MWVLGAAETGHVDSGFAAQAELAWTNLDDSACHGELMPREKR